MEDTMDLGSIEEIHESSSLFRRTIPKQPLPSVTCNRLVFCEKQKSVFCKSLFVS